MSSHKPRKRFGQHFLQDEHVIERFISLLALESTDHVVEIGPGLGALTAPLAAACQQLDVIEIDRDAVHELAPLCQQFTHCHIHCADILKFDLSSLINASQNAKSSLRVVGNLPYNISSPILFHLFQYLKYIKDMNFMLQKEFVERMAAGVNTSDYGRLSVMVQYYCEVTPLFVIPPTAFWPPPKVDSAYVRLLPRTKPQLLVQDHDLFAEIVRLAFNQRRKTIRNSLRTRISDSQLTALDIDPNWRPQQVSVENFAKVANFLYNNIAL